MSNYVADEWKGEPIRPRDEPIDYRLDALDMEEDGYTYRLSWMDDGVHYMTHVPAAAAERIAFWRNKYKDLARTLGVE